MGTLFTHHQKCVLVDTQATGNNRKITAFIGGLDLCDGRYDTPEHRLFKDLDTAFNKDFHNPTFPVSSPVHKLLSDHRVPSYTNSCELLNISIKCIGSTLYNLTFL